MTVRVQYKAGIDTRLVQLLLRMPRPLLDWIIGQPPIERDGRTLNRHLQALLVIASKLNLDISNRSVSVADRRKELARAARLGMPLRQGVHITDRTFDGPVGPIALRLYRRYGTTDTVPAIVYYHGGGWVTGDLDTHDGTCRMIAAESGCLVISVDYHLAPEYPFPVPHEDALAAYRWVQENSAELSITPGRVGVMGDSAGGSLAAVVALETRKGEVTPPIAQCLIYPATDMTMSEPSHRLFAEGFFLEAESMHWFRAQYLPDESDWASPLASPLKTPDVAEVAPALVVTAGFDPLRDEGVRYAERLIEAAVPTRYRCYDDLVHGFFGMGILPGGLEIIAEISGAMGKMMYQAD